MEDKIKLLIETAGCNQYEAELALKSAKGNFAGALDFLNIVSPGLGILKGKFYVPEKYIYGIFLIISDVKQKNVLSVSAVVSANPAVFETDLNKSWEEIEKTVFIYRMDNGVYPEDSNNFQEKLYQISKLPHLIADSKRFEEKIRPLLLESFSCQDAIINFDYSQDTYKTQSSEDASNGVVGFSVGEKIDLSLDLLTDSGGCFADSLSVGDVVWIKITDTRDIAEYLSERLGGLDGSKVQPLATQVIAVQKMDDKIILRFRFTEKIEGTAKVDLNFKARVVSRASTGGIINWLRTIIK